MEQKKKARKKKVIAKKKVVPAKRKATSNKSALQQENERLKAEVEKLTAEKNMLVKEMVNDRQRYATQIKLLERTIVQKSVAETVRAMTAEGSVQQKG